MKVLVDEMPAWSGECLFAEEKISVDGWKTICKITGEICDLHYNGYIKDDECHAIKAIEVNK